MSYGNIIVEICTVAGLILSSEKDSINNPIVQIRKLNLSQIIYLFNVIQLVNDSDEAEAEVLEVCGPYCLHCTISNSKINNKRMHPLC